MSKTIMRIQHDFCTATNSIKLCIIVQCLTTAF